MSQSPVPCRYLPIGLTLLIGTIFTTASSWGVIRAEQQRQSLIHQQEALALANKLQQEVDQIFQVSETAGMFIGTNTTHNLRNFRSVTQLLLEQHSLAAMGWVDLVPHKNRAAYEQTYGTIVELDHKQHVTAATPQPAYAPLTQIQPLSANFGILGTNIATIPTEFETLIAAQDKRQTQITPPLFLPNKKPALIAYLPVLNQSQPAGQKKLLGFIRSTLQLDKLIKQVSQQEGLNRHSFYLQPLTSNPTQSERCFYYDAQQNQIQSLQLARNPMPEFCALHPNACQQLLNIGHQKWQVVVLPNAKDNLQFYKMWQFWLTLGLDVTIVLTLSLYLFNRIRQTAKIEQLSQMRATQAEQLNQTLGELRQTQAHLIQAEKMSSLGQLVAGIAHEINNPVNFIHGNLRHIDRYSQDLLSLITAYEQIHPQPLTPNSAQNQTLLELREEIDLEFLREDLGKVVASMHTGTDRIRQIVLSLRNFSRLDESERKTVNIHDGIESTLLILQHRLKKTNENRRKSAGQSLGQRPEIQIIKQYSDLPWISCYPGLLNQVIMNLLSNAIDAVESISHAPMITIQTCQIDDRIRIGISDNGIGMDEITQASLFNPFFTTKPVGQGTGLGLSISYKIITEQHQGKIWADSMINQGSTFWIELPKVKD